MRRLRLSIVIALLALWSAGDAKGSPPYQKHPRTLKYPGLQFIPPEPARRALPNGLVLYLMEDHELPLFQVQAYLKTGSLYDPPGKAGTASLAARVLRTGGGTAFTGDDIDRRLDSVGGELEISAGTEFTVLQASSLQKDADTLLEVVAEILQRPAFPEEKVALARSQLLEEIRRQNDEPSEIADRVFKQALYGLGNPWARTPTPAEVESITREDLVQFYRQTFVPQHVVMAVAGDEPLDALARRVSRWLGPWERRPPEIPAVPPVVEPAGPRVLLVSKQVPQANLRLGHLGIPRNHPDRYAVRVLNQILGLGDFSSRLVRDVRSQKGLAYAVWGYLGEGRDRGIFEMGAETKVPSARAAIDAMVQALAELVDKPVSPPELSDARDALVNSFVARFTSPFQVAAQRAYLETLGFPDDYLVTYPQQIGAVTAEDVQRVARKYLHPDRLVTVVVGPAAELRSSLQGLGPLAVVTPEGTPCDQNHAGDGR